MMLLIKDEIASGIKPSRRQNKSHVFARKPQVDEAIWTT